MGSFPAKYQPDIKTTKFLLINFNDDVRFCKCECGKTIQQREEDGKFSCNPLIDHLKLFHKSKIEFSITYRTQEIIIMYVDKFPKKG